MAASGTLVTQVQPVRRCTGRRLRDSFLVMVSLQTGTSHVTKTIAVAQPVYVLCQQHTQPSIVANVVGHMWAVVRSFLLTSVAGLLVVVSSQLRCSRADRVKALALHNCGIPVGKAELTRQKTPISHMHVRMSGPRSLTRAASSPSQSQFASRS